MHKRVDTNNVHDVEPELVGQATGTEVPDMLCLQPAPTALVFAIGV